MVYGKTYEDAVRQGLDAKDEIEMQKKLTLALLPTRSFDGSNLKNQILALAEKKGFIVRLLQDGDNWGYVHTCTRSDVVIVDATVEAKEQHNYATMTPLSLDHLLIVSRTYLPINVYGLRDGIKNQEDKEVYGAPFYPRSQSNDEIIHWLDLQLNDLLSQLPRAKKGLIPYFLQALGKSSRWGSEDIRRNQNGQVFISYRNTGNVFSEVKELAARIQQGEFHPTQKLVRYFPPYLLSNELMSEQRRWQILSFIDRFIGPAEEIWVYETEDYYDSWWTIGELATLAYRQKVGYRGRPVPKLRIFHPRSKIVSDAPSDYLPHMNDEQRRRIGRLYVNSDTRSIAPEAVAAANVYQSNFSTGKGSYLRDHVWSKEFWVYPILDCRRCRPIGKNRNNFNLDDFIKTEGRGFTRFSSEEMREFVHKGFMRCPQCGSNYKVEQGSSQYVWIWIPGDKRREIADFWIDMLDNDPKKIDDYSLIPFSTYRLIS